MDKRDTLKAYNLPYVINDSAIGHMFQQSDEEEAQVSYTNIISQQTINNLLYISIKRKKTIPLSYLLIILINMLRNQAKCYLFMGLEMLRISLKL